MPCSVLRYLFERAFGGIVILVRRRLIGILLLLFLFSVLTAATCRLRVCALSYTLTTTKRPEWECCVFGLDG